MHSRSYVASFVTQRHVRFKTSRTPAAFVDGRPGGRGNEVQGRWVRVKPGTIFHLLSVTRSPDQATLLMEDNGQETALILREKGWEALKSVLRNDDRKRLNDLEEAAV